MARSKRTGIELTAYDDLFETDESRAEANLSKIREILISEIDEFPDHPFKVLMNEDMEQLVESVSRSGVITPATVRQKHDRLQPALWLKLCQQRGEGRHEKPAGVAGLFILCLPQLQVPL